MPAHDSDGLALANWHNDQYQYSLGLVHGHLFLNHLAFVTDNYLFGFFLVLLGGILMH